jgi:hypothetical protein
VTKEYEGQNQKEKEMILDRSVIWWGYCFIVRKLRRSVLEGRKAPILVVKATYAGLQLQSLKID